MWNRQAFQLASNEVVINTDQPPALSFCYPTPESLSAQPTLLSYWQPQRTWKLKIRHDSSFSRLNRIKRRFSVGSKITPLLWSGAKSVTEESTQKLCYKEKEDNGEGENGVVLPFRLFPEGFSPQ